MMKKMNVLVASFAILTSWITCSMEPKVMSQEATLETVAGPEGSWVRFFEETVPGYRSSKAGFPPSSRISQQLAQEVLRKRPQMRAFILSQIAVPFKECVGHTDAVWSAKFNSTGDKVVTASPDKTARIWETETGSLLYTLEGHTSLFSSAAFSPTGDKVVTASGDQTAQIWDIANARLHILDGHAGFVRSAEFTAGGDKVVTASNDRTAKIWDATNGELLQTLSGHTGWVALAEFNPTGDKVVTASWDETAILWESETGSRLHTLKGHTQIVWSAKFNSAGDKVVTASADGRVKIWDVETGSCLYTLNPHIGGIRSAMFNPRGDKVVTTSGQTARIWDLSGLLETEQFLAEDITLQQVALLLDIFEVMKARHYLTALKQEFPEKGTSLRPEDSTFDFNSYSDLWNDYEKLPEAMKAVFDRYITKPLLERDLKRLHIAEEPSKRQKITST